MNSPLKNLVFQNKRTDVLGENVPHNSSSYTVYRRLSLGLTDANTVLPADIPLETPMDIFVRPIRSALCYSSRRYHLL